jgi:ABC-type branched-subunit amino acid transport system permease subunit
MSIEFLQVSGNTTSLRAPDNTVQSALTSNAAFVTLANGAFTVNQAGLAQRKVYPEVDNTNVDISGNDFTISPVASVMLVSAASARTGLILAPPAVRKTGVELHIINRSSVNHTFAVAGTSRVADGGNQRLLSNSHQSFMWSEPDTRWYPSATK